MEDSGRYAAINATLRRLEQYVTLPPFCRAFYRLIYGCRATRRWTPPSSGRPSTSSFAASVGGTRPSAAS